VPAPLSRRNEYAAETRQALVENATRLFVERGFSGTSLEQVASAARVTRGAVYHHFANKQALFQAVLEEVDAQTMNEIVEQATAVVTSTWDSAVAGFDAFLDRCLDPTYQRICFEEGPTALGFVAWWKHGEAHVAGLLKGLLGALKNENLIALEDVDALATAIYGALTAGAIAISRAEDPRAVRDGMRTTIIRMMQGLQPANAKPVKRVR
jgi:AcrR family transcriptional regulator